MSELGEYNYCIQCGSDLSKIPTRLRPDLCIECESELNGCDPVVLHNSETGEPLYVPYNY